MEYVILIVVIAALLTALVIGFRNRNAAEKGQVLAVDAGGPWAKKARPVPKPHAPPFLPKADAGPQPTGKSAGGAVQVFIHYKDANGYESKRRITLRKVSSAGDGAYITAYCHEREGDRAQPFIGTSLPLPPPIGDRGGIEPLAPHDGTDCAWNARSAINLAKNAQLLPGGEFAPTGPDR